MVLYPVLVTAVVGINELVQDKRIFSTLAVAMAVLLTTLTVLMAKKIKGEHKIYKYIGGKIVKIWEYFKLFDHGVYISDDSILGPESKGYGKGPGYLKTLYILWAMTIIADTILIAVGLIKYLA